MVNYSKILVTGGSGFLGRHIHQHFVDIGAKVYAPRSNECDLTSWNQTRDHFQEFRPELVIHCAAVYGGIRFNGLYPGRIMQQNLLMGVNVVEACREFSTKKLVVVGSASAYPGYLDHPAREEELWEGAPHDALKAYGGAKRVLHLMVQAYRNQYGLNGIYVIPPNLYGPWDTFDPDRSHVVCALLRRVLEAKEEGQESVQVWGSGNPLRDFLYIDDCVNGIQLAVDNYDEELPLNLGTGVPTSILQVAEAVREVIGYPGALCWDSTRPDGQAMILLEVSRMEKLLNWKPPTSFEEGLIRTAQWYMENREIANARL